MLYSQHNNYPTELPHTIRLSSGMTRSDITTFTQEEIDDAGYVPVEDPPSISDTETLRWGLKGDNFQWIIEQISTQDMWMRVLAMRDVEVAKTENTLNWIRQRRGDGLPTNSIEYENKIVEYLREVSTIGTLVGYTGDPFKVKWPKFPATEFHLGLYPPEIAEQIAAYDGDPADILPAIRGWREMQQMQSK